MKRKLISVLSLSVPLVAGAQNPSVDQLQTTVNDMQKTIINLQQQLQEVKRQQQAVAAGPVATTTPSTNGIVFVPPTINHPNPSEVRWREELRDYQEAAPRPNDKTLDPEFKGFIPIPNTLAFIRFNAKPRVDLMYDNRNPGNLDRFVPAQIPVSSEPTHGGGNRFNVNMRGSSLSLDLRAPEAPGNLRFYYNNDFFGGGLNTGPGYRLKHLYGDFFNVTAGFTYSVFEDPDVWPDTVDFEGPNSMIFARQATLRYAIPMGEHWQLNLGVQQPASDIDTFGLDDVASANRAPDGGVNLRWEKKDVGHIQLATILREVGADSPTLGRSSEFGWGAMGAANFDIFARDSIQLQGTYGEGYFHYINDNFTYSGFNGGDAAFDSAGHLKLLTCYSGMLGFTHKWTDKWRSTVSGGYVHLENEASQGPLAYHKTYYGSGNLVCQVFKRMSVGVEGLYGRKEVKSGDTGEVWRAQLGVVFSLFEH